MEKPNNITLIGMPGAGKSTIGRILARLLNFAYIDSDMALEALYGRPLQVVTEALDTEAFRNAEAEVICNLDGENCVFATGGSVIYRPRAMEHLRKLGIIVWLNPSLEAIMKRVATKPDRGISYGPGQSLEDLFAERNPLYAKYADYFCNTADGSAEECAKRILAVYSPKLID